MNLNISNWKRFSLGRLFDIKKGRRLTAEDQEDGINPYVGAIDSNNGIANHIGQQPIHSGNTISLSYNGSVGEAFYQPEPYWASDDVNALYPKFKGFNELIGLFIAAVIRAEKYRFSYGRKWKLESMKTTEICLPVQHDSDGKPVIDFKYTFSNDGFLPDWNFMEEYVKSLHYKPLKTKNKRKKSLTINVNDWKDFLVGDLFTIRRGDRIVHDEDYFDIPDNEYKYPVITTTTVNNGIDGYYNQFNADGNCIVSGGEANGMFTTYQETPFWGLDTVRIYKPIGFTLNKFIGLFFATELTYNMYRFSYGRKAKPDNMYTLSIKLPVDSHGKPDWKFMEKYMKSLPYGDRI